MVEWKVYVCVCVGGGGVRLPAQWDDDEGMAGLLQVILRFHLKIQRQQRLGE